MAEKIIGRHSEKALPGKILQLWESGVYRYVWATQNRQDFPDSTILQKSVFF